MATRIKCATHEEWLKTRADGIGASEVGAIVGAKDAYTSAYKVWLKKVGKDTTEEVSNALICGHLFEDAVAKFFALRTGAKIVEASADEWIYVHDEKPFMRVSPDRLYYNDGDKHTKANLRLLECKTTNLVWDEDTVSENYYCQCQYQMHVMGVKHCTLAWIHLASREFGFVDFEYDEEFCTKVIETKVTEFWTRYVIGQEEPPVEVVEDLAFKYPRSIIGTQTEADDSIESKARQLAEVKRRIKAIEKENEALFSLEKELADSLKLSMQGAENLVAKDGSLLATYKSAKDKQIFNVARAIERYPDLADNYDTVAGNRSFLLKVKAS